MAHISRCHKAPLATTAILHSRTLTTRATARILWSFLQPEVQALHPTVAWPELFSYTHFFLTLPAPGFLHLAGRVLCWLGRRRLGHLSCRHLHRKRSGP